MKAGDIVVKEFPDSMTVYCYNFHDDLCSEKGACVKHIFTGPYETLKTRATDLFDRIQEGLELSWQSVTAGIAEGISAISSIISARASHLLFTAVALFRPILLLGIAPPRLGRERDPIMHSPNTKAHLRIRQQVR